MRGVSTVPSRLRNPPAVTCWNCDRKIEQTVAVTLRAPSGGEASLRLCRPCHDSVYVPLIARTEATNIAAG